MHITSGIVLKRGDFRERDERVVLYTQEFGKISVIAKGVKRIEAKLRGNLDIFNFVDIIFVEGSRFFILTGVEMREKFPHIAKNASLYKTALAITDIIDAVFQENLPDANFFEILLAITRDLDRCYTNSRQGREIDLYSWLIQKKFQIMLLEHEGYSLRQASFIASVGSKLSHNAKTLLEALRFKEKREGSIRLASRDFRDIEGLFEGAFATLLGMKVATWIPKIKQV